jgi:large subunit ribosomal protein L35
MPKNKPNKGLLKRIRLTKSGKVKFGRAYGRHLRSHKSASLLRSYRKAKYATAGDARRVRNMLWTSIKTQPTKTTHAESEQD